MKQLAAETQEEDECHKAASSLLFHRAQEKHGAAWMKRHREETRRQQAL